MNMGVTEYIARIDAAMIVVDCAWNMQPAQITSSMAPLVKYLRANGHPTTPIVMVEGTTHGQAWIVNSTHPGADAQAVKRRAFAAAYAAILAKTGDGNLHYVGGDALYHHAANGTGLAWSDFDDPTVGGLHPTDLGHTRCAS